MYPWLLADMRKDDLAARYKRAEQSRLAAEIRKNPTPAGVDANDLAPPAGVRRQVRNRMTASGIEHEEHKGPFVARTVQQRLLDFLAKALVFGQE